MTESLATYDGNGVLIGRCITRCEDCRHFTREEDFSPSEDTINKVMVGKCGYFDATVTGDGFCAWGWRKE